MISRRAFASAVAASAFLPSLSRTSVAAGPPSGEWRRFALTTRIDLEAKDGPAQAWLPLAGFEAAAWSRVGGNDWQASANATLRKVNSNGADMLHVRWEGRGPHFVEVKTSVTTRDRVFRPDEARDLTARERAFYLRGSPAVPTEGPVKDLADHIVGGRTRDIDKARALYQWVVEHTYRAAEVRGCGEGNILAMVKSGVFGGKCADLNPLFVALARASGLPARDLYGIRVAPSRLGYKSLGPSTPLVTKAQHCRAEVFLDGLGWTAMDPADVRKIMLEEKPGGLSLDDAKVSTARARLFGSWEGNWFAFNAANDVVLPGRSDPRPVHFLMYPQIETVAGLLNCYDPDAIRYKIVAEELAI